MRPITLVLTIRDGKNKDNQMLLNVTNTEGSTNVVNQLETARLAQIAVDSLTEAKIIRCGLILDVELDPSIKTIADPNSDVEAGALFIWKTTEGNATQTRIPAFDESKIKIAERVVLLTDPDVDAFNDLVVFGYLDVDFQDTRKEVITELLSAREVFEEGRI